MTAEPAKDAAVERSRIPEHLKWDLSRIFPDTEAWEREFAALEADLPRLADHRGRLAASGRALREALEAVMDFGRRLEVLRVYASMRSDEDARIGENTARKGRAGTLSVRVGEAVSWLEPELLSLEDDDLRRLNDEDEGLALYAHYLDDVRRLRAHTLDAPREELLAKLLGVMQAPVSGMAGVLAALAKKREEEGAAA